MKTYNSTETEEILNKMSLSDQWRFEGNSLKAEFKFADFKMAMQFMVEAAKSADQIDHHPDWSNVYNKVFIQLNTHSEGGVTDLDFKLASSMSQIIKSGTHLQTGLF